MVVPRISSQNGIIPKAATVLIKVIVIDKLISPLSNRHQKFDPVPPGQHPSTNSPSLNRGLSNIRYPTPYDNCKISKISNILFTGVFDNLLSHYLTKKNEASISQTYLLSIF